MRMVSRPPVHKLERRIASRKQGTSAEQLRALTRVIDVLGRSPETNLSDVYDVALVGLQKALGIKRAAILLFDADGVMRFKAWRGISDVYRKMVEGHSPWTPDSLDAEPLVIADVHREPALEGLLPVFRAEHIRALAFIPLTFERRVLGKFMLYSRHVHGFEDELHFASTLARLIAFAIVRIRKESALRLSEDQFLATLAERKHLEKNAEYLANASRVLVSSLDYERTLRAIGEVVVPELGDWCLLGVIDDDSGFRWQAFIANPLLQTLKKEIENAGQNLKGSSALANVLQTGHSFLERNESEKDHVPEQTMTSLFGFVDLAKIEAIRTLGLASVMIVPLVLRDNPMGVCLIASARPEHPYDTTDTALAEELARRAAVALENARLYRESLRSIQLREDFISIASHELRTPLTPLKLQLFLLKHHIEDVAAQLPKGHTLMRALQSSDRQLERITRLIDDLLDVSRLTRGQLVLNLEETSLDEIVRDVVERCHNELDLSKCRLQFESNDAVRGRWDKLRIEQVVENLLTNAMKYGAGKPIEVIISKRDDWARLEVHDLGIGIAKEDQERIFQRFERAVPITAYGGLGLGLFITRQIVAAHNGTVHIESELGRGATFIVELPSIPLPAKVEETEGKLQMTNDRDGK